MTGYFVGGIAFDYRFFAVVPTFLMVCAGVLSGDFTDEVADEASAQVPGESPRPGVGTEYGYDSELQT